MLTNGFEGSSSALMSPENQLQVNLADRSSTSNLDWELGSSEPLWMDTYHRTYLKEEILLCSYVYIAGQIESNRESVLRTFI